MDNGAYYGILHNDDDILYLDYSSENTEMLAPPDNGEGELLKAIYRLLIEKPNFALYTIFNFFTKVQYFYFVLISKLTSAL